MPLEDGLVAGAVEDAGGPVGMTDNGIGTVGFWVRVKDGGGDAVGMLLGSIDGVFVGAADKAIVGAVDEVLSARQTRGLHAGAEHSSNSLATMTQAWSSSKSPPDGSLKLAIR